MGCGDSQQIKVQSKDNKTGQKKKKGLKELRFAPTQGNGKEVDQESNQQENQAQGRVDKGDSPQKTYSKNQTPAKSQKSKESKGVIKKKEQPKAQKQNLAKVKKARELRKKPEDDKFINNIMDLNRSKLISQFPSLPHTKSEFIKPVVEYMQPSKGSILPNQSELNIVNTWNMPISSAREKANQVSYNGSYLAVNEAAKSPYRQRQIEARLQDIRLDGRLRNDSFESNNIGTLHL